MSTGTQPAIAVTRPSDEIREAQAVVRRLLIADDLLEEEESLLTERVRDKLTKIEAQLGELWGRQMMFEAVMKT